MSITRTAWTDDSGAGTDGTILNNAAKTTLYDELDGRWSELPVTSTGTQNNLSITSGSIEADVLRCNNASDLTITGIAKPASPAKPGKRLVIYSIGAGHVFLAHQNASSTAGNRLINFATSGNTPLFAGSGFAVYVYDGTVTDGRWRLEHHDQGAWLTPTFAAGNYTANGSMTWTLASGDVITQAYHLRGRRLRVAFVLSTTSVGGTPNTQLQIGNAAWGSFTAMKQMYGNLPYLNDGGTLRTAIMHVGASGTNLIIRRQDLGNFTASTDTTEAYGEIEFEVN